MGKGAAANPADSHRARRAVPIDTAAGIDGHARPTPLPGPTTVRGLCPSYELPLIDEGEDTHETLLS